MIGGPNRYPRGPYWVADFSHQYRYGPVANMLDAMRIRKWLITRGIAFFDIRIIGERESIYSEIVNFSIWVPSLDVILTGLSLRLLGRARQPRVNLSA